MEDRTKDLEEGVWIYPPEYEVPMCPDIIKVYKSTILPDGTKINTKEFNKVDGKWIERIDIADPDQEC